MNSSVAIWAAQGSKEKHKFEYFEGVFLTFHWQIFLKKNIVVSTLRSCLT